MSHARPKLQWVLTIILMSVLPRWVCCAGQGCMRAGEGKEVICKANGWHQSHAGSILHGTTVEQQSTNNAILSLNETHFQIGPLIAHHVDLAVLQHRELPCTCGAMTSQN